MTMPYSRFILASASPRRNTLLREAGYCFDTVPSGVDEEAFLREGIAPEQFARTVALAKAQDVAGLFPEAVVLGCDTIVDLDGQIIGKPSDAAHAEEITRALFRRAHKVITGVALVCIERAIEIVRSDTTVIYPRPMSDEQMRAHIAGGTWEGKAGAYAIQETGDALIERIEGSFTNVVGLPMELVQRLLASVLGP